MIYKLTTTHSVVHHCAQLVMEAITELDEEDGSTEDSISGYLKSRFEDFPLAHIENKYKENATFVKAMLDSAQLDKALQKLRKEGKIKVTEDSTYVLTIPPFKYHGQHARNLSCPLGSSSQMSILDEGNQVTAAVNSYLPSSEPIFPTYEFPTLEQDYQYADHPFANFELQGWLNEEVPNDPFINYELQGWVNEGLDNGQVEDEHSGNAEDDEIWRNIGWQ